MIVLILCSCCRQLRFSLCSGAVTTRTWFSCYTLLAVVPSSMRYLMPNACQLASCSSGMSYYASCSCSYVLTFPMSLSSATPYFFSAEAFFSAGALLPLFIQGVFSLNPGIACSDYVHPGIACLVFWASNWVGAFWGSLSGFVISHLL